MARRVTAAPSTTPDPVVEGAGDPDTAPELVQVYDDRGNVRPHGTPGARPMTYAERVTIAAALGSPDAAPEV